MIFWIKYKNFANEDVPNQLGEFFNDTKSNKIARLYLFFDSLRKISLIAWLSFFPSIDKYLRISVFIAIQMLFTTYMAITKPFDMTRDNLREILNECMVTGFSLALLNFNTEENWTDTYASVI